MAIQKEIWMDSIVGGLFASNSFLSKAFDADGYVNAGKTVHIPNAGAASGTKKNRTDLPAEVKRREDIDLTFVLDEFTTDPILIPNADTVELSYNKRESVIDQDKQALHDAVALSFIYNWSPAASRCIETTGEVVDAYTSEATGKRKALTKNDVLNVMTKFNEENIPQADRYLLIDARMHSQLLNSLTDQENAAFLASADVQNGIIGKLYGFNIVMRSQAALYDAQKVRKAWDAKGVATDLAAALAWHKSSVCRALGQVEAFENEGSPLYYGDVYSFLVRAGGRIMRNDSKGVMAIVQGVPAEAK